MAANPNPLQGSLFGEIIKETSSDKSIESGKNVTGEDLSDEELTQDSRTRPRKKNEQESHQFVKKTPSQQVNNSNSEDLPAWSHHNIVPMEQLTPALRHYVTLKKANPERILLYRLGDFFECFFEDAITLSRLLELTLTSKEGGKSIGRVPMAGVPHHAAERYCAEIIRRGLSISICDQIDHNSTKVGSPIRREITRIITPGTVIEEGMLQARKNNWLGAVIVEESNKNKDLKWGLAKADVSTGDFLVTEGQGKDALKQELLKIDAAEIITEKYEETSQIKWCPQNLYLTETPKTPFSLIEAETTLKKYYKLGTIKGLGIHKWTLAVRASGGLITYLQKTKPIIKDSEDIETNCPIVLDFPQISLKNDVLIIDAQTRRNLEITSTQKDGLFQGSLLWAIDKTLTSMGSRCLRRWLESPLIDANEILSRQEIVSLLVESTQLRSTLRKSLRTMSDLERLAGRAGAGQAGARDLVAIADSLERLPRIAQQLQKLPPNAPHWLKTISTVNQSLVALSNKLKNILISNPPLSLSEGGLVHDGVDPLLDGLRNQLDDQNEWLKNQELKERKNSMITTLKLQYHRTFGYFLAVSKSKAANVPHHWIRRQTLANEERFITPDLKEREGKIFQLKARAAQREYEIFCTLREEVGKKAKEIRNSARGIAGLDSLAALAELAATNYYVAPSIIEEKNINESPIINIQNCRHPVVEQMLEDNKFQANDINIGGKTDLIILSGPNASGKSCYLRQIGLVQLLSQIGSWVPASKASISIADKIFTRVGAVDDLAAGQSTFMVEMTETAFILNQATNRSLVLLDEIGRGTSTFDGLSIAWAVSECLAQEIKSRSIFATHYHELNQISEKLNNVENFQVLVDQKNGKLNFLHKVIPGGTNKSYGIEAARLAGVPKKVINRASHILKSLEEKKLNQSQNIDVIFSTKNNSISAA